MDISEDMDLELLCFNMSIKIYNTVEKGVLRTLLVTGALLWSLLQKGDE